MRSLFLYSVTLGVLVCMPLASHAATLTLPSRGPFVVGQTFSIPVYVSTKAGEAMNAASGSITYPTDKLQVVAVTKGSLISFWTQEPAAASGVVSFEGGVYNPGFSGTNGNLITVTFKVLSAGAAPLTFSSASVLANDGQGTNILDNATGVTLALSASAAPAPAPVSSTPSVASPTGGVPVVTSSTHPDQMKWYNTQTVKLDWKLPPGTTAVRIGYDRSPIAQPTVVYEPAIKHKDLSLGDGIWYFRVQARTADGWGSPASYKIRIDTVPPVAPPIVFPHGATTTDPRPIITFNTTDDLSGIAYYNVQVNGNGLLQVSTDSVKSNPYPVQIENPGIGQVTVVAYDQAGNSASSSAAFEVIGLNAPQIDPITDITEGDIFQISGVTYPNARVDVYLENEKGEKDSWWGRTAGNGSFRIIWKNRLHAGVYSFTVQVTDDRGAKSDMSNPVSFKVSPQPFATLGWVTLNIASFGLLLVALLISILVGGAYLWQRFHGLRRHLLHRVDPIHRALHKEFEDLKDAIAAEVTGLDKVKTRRQLTEEEDRMLERLTALVEKSERVIEREMETLITARHRKRPSTGDMG